MANPTFSAVFAQTGNRATLTANDYTSGWLNITANNTRPPSYTEFNTLQNSTDIKLNYLDKRARNIWDAQIDYEIDSYALGTSGDLYKCTAYHLGLEPTANEGVAWVKVAEVATVIPPPSSPSTQIPDVVGSIVMFAGLFPMGNHALIFCDGSELSRTQYSALFQAIGTRYGAGNGSSTFNVPDLRGEFIRAVDEGRGVDIGRNLGSSQVATGIRAKGIDFIPTSDPDWHRPHVAAIDNDEFWLEDGEVRSRMLVGTDSSVTEAYISWTAKTRPRNIALKFYIQYSQ